MSLDPSNMPAPNATSAVSRIRITLMRKRREIGLGMNGLDGIAEEVALWQNRVGSSQTYREQADCTLIRRFASAVGEDLSDTAKAPIELAHWAMFKDDTSRCILGADGHATRPDGVIPQFSSANRMLVATSLEFARPLQIGLETELQLTLKDIREREGRSGHLILVDTERSIFQNGRHVLKELQTMAYLSGRRSKAATPGSSMEAKPSDEVWTPSPVDLFRFSAATFNAHRIHYDLAYAREVEGYPALVVQGPFTAAKLLFSAMRRNGRRPSRFSYRANAPLFVERPVRLTTTAEEREMLAIRDDGVIAMTAQAAFE